MFIQKEANELIAALTYVKENLAEQVEELAAQIIKAFKNGNKVILMGNGGSAGDAQHTAVGNDYSYDVIFSRQIDGFAQPGDVVIGISTSGNSKNVHLALELAKERGCYTAALLGKDGGTIKDIADLPIVVKWPNTPRVQECHIFIGHSVCDLVDQAF